MKNIWVPLSGQVAQQRQVETIANNVANANTVGFKKDRLAFKEQLTALTKGLEDINIPNKEFEPKDFYHTQGAENALVKVEGNFTVQEQGQLNPTNNPLDLAVSGGGFFEVLTPNGIRYTRKGDFSLNQFGHLVNDQGYPVLSASNSDESIAEDRLISLPLDKRISITHDGSIIEGDQTLAKISLKEFIDPHALKKEGNSLFINPGAENLITDKVSSTIRQGFLESSNVNAIEEMAELIKAHRHFESLQKAMKAYDDINRQAVNDISKF